MADVLFWYLTHDSPYNKGIAYISAVLKQYGHSTDLLVLDLRKDDAQLKREIRDGIEAQKPYLIAVSSMTCHWSQLSNLLDYTEQITRTPILVGGWHPSISPEEVIGHDAVHYICLGEGEFPTLELVERLKKMEETDNILNIWSQKDQHIHRNPLRPLISNLDDLPLPDRDLFSFQDLVNESALSGIGPEGPRRVAVISSGRGCLYECAYCCNAAYRKLYRAVHRDFVRRRTVDSLMEEIAHVIETYDPMWIEFWEENFVIDHGWLKEFAVKYGKKFGLPFSIPVRPNHVLKDEFRLLREANCKLVYMGVECGNERYRKKYMNRHLSNEQILEAFRLARKNGVATLSFNMVGLPFETLSEIEETLSINEMIEPDFLGCYIYTPFPGTELYSISKKAGLIKGEISPVYYAGNTPNLKGIDDNAFLAVWTRIENFQARLAELRVKRQTDFSRN